MGQVIECTHSWRDFMDPMLEEVVFRTCRYCVVTWKVGEPEPRVVIGRITEEKKD